MRLSPITFQLNLPENAAGIPASGSPDAGLRGVRSEEWIILNEIASAVGDALDLRQMLREAGRKVMRLFGYEGLAFYLTDPARREAQLALCIGLGAQQVRRTAAVVPFGQGLAGRVSLDGASVFLSRSEEIARLAIHPSLARLGLQTIASIPLRARDRVVGVLNLSSAAGREITESERRLLESMGSLLGVAIDNAQLYERTQARARQLRVENAIASQLRRPQDTRQIFETVLRELCLALRASRCFIAELDDGQVVVSHEYRRGDFPSLLGPHPMEQFASDVMRRLTSQQTLIIEDTMTDPRSSPLYPTHYAPYQIRSVLSIPLLVGGEMCAVLGIQQCRRRRRWSADDIDLAQAVAAQAALALENSRLFEMTRRSEQEYMALYDQAPDMYHSVDPEGRIVRCNATESKTLGYHKSELIGKRWSELCTSEEERRTLEKRLAGFAAGDVRAFMQEMEIRHKSGSLLHVSIRAVPVYEKQVYTGARVVMRDITTQKQLERQLVQAQKMESLGTLAGGIAHDFNNLLTGMIGYASLIKRHTSPEDPLHKYAETIEKSGERAADLTRQLLAFSRTSTLQSRLINLNDVVQETVALLSRSLVKQVTLDLYLEHDLASIEADPVQMEQVLLNLCVNARDAMPAGGKLTITTRNCAPEEADNPRWRVEPPARCIMLSIADTGMGMDEQTRARIFDPFFTTKEPGKGTGLGLAMVYGIVSQHNGAIEVQSEVGAGTTFRVYLPATERRASPAPPETADMPLRRVGSVLVVDDEDDIRVLLRDTLTGLGLEVYTAGGGREAVAFYREHAAEVDLVIMDMMMPNMDGREAFWQLRATDPGARIVLMSGYSDEATVQALLRAGARGFLQKPWNRRDLLVAIREAMGEAEKG